MPFRSVQLDLEFLESFSEFGESDRRRFLKALRLLDDNERHPSLRVHELQGELAGLWSAPASDVLRMTFRRLPMGRKLMLQCSRHYDR
jgi:hypothetical protein